VNAPGPDAVRRRWIGAALAAAAAPALRAQDAPFPSGPVVIVVPSTPGSMTDRAAASVAGRLSAIWKQPVTLEYRAGAAGVTGAAHVASAPPDGRTLLFAAVGTLAIVPALAASMPYDAASAFAPISLIAETPMAWAVGPSVPPKAAASIGAFVDHVRAHPGRLSYASNGVGSAPHVFTELFLARVGIDMHHVPFRGGTPALSELLDGRVDAAMLTTLQVPEARASGRVRVLAVTSRSRLPGLPDIPSLSETVARGFRTTIWVGLLAPAGTPAPIVAQIGTDLKAGWSAAPSSAPPAFSDSAELGTTIHLSNPAAFTSFLAAEQSRYAAIVRRGRIAAD
jgi:tripartite-type tricarboxylate transporter receptor subunit TctC